MTARPAGDPPSAAIEEAIRQAASFAAGRHVVMAEVAYLQKGPNVAVRVGGQLVGVFDANELRDRARAIAIEWN